MVLSLHALWPISRESFRVLVSALPGAPAVPLASSPERERIMLGDRWIPGPDFECTRALNVSAEPSAVWSRLAQMMRGPSVWGWSKLEAPEQASADGLVARLTPPSVGDRCGSFFELVAVEPGQELVWCSAAPLNLLDVTLECLTLDYRVEAQEAGSRLIVRVRVACHDATAPLRVHAFRVLDFILPGAQLLRVKRSSERNGALSCSPETPALKSPPDLR